MQNLFNDKNFKKNIVVNIFASIIVFIFIEPLFSLLWKFVLWISTNSYSSYIDSVYENAALGPRNWLDFLWFALLIVILILYSSSLVSKLSTTLKKLKYEESLERIANEGEKENLKKRYESVEKKINFITKHSSRIIISMRIALVFGFLVGFLNIFSAYADLQLNTSFTQRLKTIAPYIDEQKEEELNAKWSIMKSRKDFELIDYEVESIAANNKIKLPKKLLK